MPRDTEPITTISPTVAHILESLKSRIASGEFRTGGRLPAERTLAEEFRVSRTIIRQALDTLEEHGFLQRVNGFRPVVCDPARIERSAASVLKRNIALWITGEPNDVGAASVLQGIQRGLDPEQFRLVVANPRGETMLESIQTEAQFLRRLAEDADICGVILWYLGGDTNLPGLERLRALRMPMVFVDRRPPCRFLGDYVGVDNRHGAAQVVAHLVARGHRRIAHITNEESACTVAERLGGYRDALQNAGIPFDPHLVLSGPFQEPEEYRYNAIVQGLSELADPPTAVFAVNDYSALCLVAAASTLGLRVPDDLEVAGFDDLERWRPGQAVLTTASQPFERMGMQAARLLLERMEAPCCDTYASVIMDAPLVIRAGAQSEGP